MIYFYSIMNIYFEYFNLQICLYVNGVLYSILVILFIREEVKVMVGFFFKEDYKCLYYVYMVLKIVFKFISLCEWCGFFVNCWCQQVYFF